MSAGSTESPDGQVPAADSAAAAWALPRGVVVLLGTAGAVLTAAGLRGFADIAGPVFLALVLTIAVSPLRRLLVRRGVKGWIAGLIALVTVYVFLLGMAAALAYSVAKLATLLPTYEDKFAELVDDVRGWLADRGVGTEQLQAALQAIDLGQFFDVLQGWLSGLLGVVSSLGLIVVVLFFMCIDAAPFANRLGEAARIRPDIAGALTGFARNTTRYLIVSTVFGLIVAVFDVGVLYLLDIPLPWLWGLLAFITNYIPNVGFIIGVVPPALLALLTGGPQLMVIVIVVYCGINFVVQSIIQPRFIGDAVGLSVTVTFVVLVFWAWLLGPLGAILAIPLTLLAKALLVDIDPQAKWADALLRDSPKDPDPDAPAKKSRRERRSERQQQKQDLKAAPS